jgi:hypothetical protein
MSRAEDAVEHADLVLHNGRIATLDDQNPSTEAVAVRDGRFFLVGTDRDALGLRGDRTRVIDLRGHTVICEHVLHLRAQRLPRLVALFAPVKVGPLELPNRIVMSPMTRIRADEGCVPSERMVRNYSQRASVVGLPHPGGGLRAAGASRSQAVPAIVLSVTLLMT